MKRAYLLSLSAIADDPRVRRMGDALHDAGWTVIGFGLPGARMAPPRWEVRVVEAPPPDPTASGGAAGLLSRTTARAAAAALAPGEAALRAARSPYAGLLAATRATLAAPEEGWRGLAAALRRRRERRARERGLSADERALADYWRLAPELRALADLADAVDAPGLWVANDWWMLPIARRGLARAGGALVYDSHELATEQFAHVPEWRWRQQGVVAAVEALHIGEARVITAVSDGICARLADLYPDAARPMRLRNTPPYEEIPFRATGATIRVLYHGVLAPGRGLEAAIDSVALWAPGRTLHLRGPSAHPGYVDSLRARVAAAGVQNRVELLPPVPVTELARSAAAFDVGLLALPAHSLHTRYALPNKVFEYLMAGLALAVSDLPELARLVGDTEAGVLFPDATPAAVAAAVNALDAHDVDRFKRAALAAARRLCWEHEHPPVIAAYARALAETAAASDTSPS